MKAKLTAVLNRRRMPMKFFPEITEFPQYAGAFREAARTCLRSLSRRQEGHDYRALPVLFLYRHAVELQLKAVIMAGSRALRATTPDPPTTKSIGTHDLGDLWRIVERVEDVYGWEWEWADATESREGFSSSLETLNEFDSGSFAFRYPVSKKGEAYFATPIKVNLSTFRRKVEGILRVLEQMEEAAWGDYENLVDSLANGLEAGTRGSRTARR